MNKFRSEECFHYYLCRQMKSARMETKMSGSDRISKEEILFITAETGDMKAGIEKSGYTVLFPYNYKTVVGRVFLEILRRTNLPQSVLFNKSILESRHKYIIIQDNIITRKFLLWLQKNRPDSKLFFQYTNMVGKAHHLLPKQIPLGIKIWTYDKHDSDKYGIALSKQGGYYTAFIGEKREKKYDVMYVGRDKGRAEYILKIKKKLEDMGLVTKFMIMPSKRTDRKKSFYSRPISYQDVIKLVTESRAILNITLPDQLGATLRDYESIYNEVKLITTNEFIETFDFYRKENVFIVGKDDFSSLVEFVRTPFVSLDSTILEKYSLDNAVQEWIR